MLADPELSWPRWWPGLRGRVLALSADDARQGSRAALAFRTPFVRRLRLELTAAHVEPPAAARFAVTGDLRGVGVVTLADDGAATVVTVHWDVRTATRWLDPVGPLSRPLARWSHAHVMRAGERGLAGELTVPRSWSRGDVTATERLEAEHAQGEGDRGQPGRGDGGVRVDREGAQVVER